MVVYILLTALCRLAQSERGAMVSGRFIDAVPSLAQRLVERGRDDAKSLILSAWINLVLATRTSPH